MTEAPIGRRWICKVDGDRIVGAPLMAGHYIGLTVDEARKLEAEADSPCPAPVGLGKFWGWTEVTLILPNGGD